jgi:hypothetical protein
MHTFSSPPKNLLGIHVSFLNFDRPCEYALPLNTDTRFIFISLPTALQKWRYCRTHLASFCAQHVLYEGLSEKQNIEFEVAYRAAKFVTILCHS